MQTRSMSRCLALFVPTFGAAPKPQEAEILAQEFYRVSNLYQALLRGLGSTTQNSSSNHITKNHDISTYKQHAINNGNMIPIYSKST